MIRQNEFGSALREAREILDMAQTDVGPNQAHVSRIEKGTKAASLKGIDEIAQNLGLHPITLLFRSYAATYGESYALLKLMKHELKDVYGIVLDEGEREG
jgi:transcriptional regulator with XRE-family HTH domain